MATDDSLFLELRHCVAHPSFRHIHRVSATNQALKARSRSSECYYQALRARCAHQAGERNDPFPRERERENAGLFEKTAKQDREMKQGDERLINSSAPGERRTLDCMARLFI